MAVMKVASELIRLKYPYFIEFQVPHIGVGKALNKAIDLCNAWKMDKKYRLQIYNSLIWYFSTYGEEYQSERIANT